MLMRKFSPFLFVVSACASFQLAGCSLIGFTIGAVSDASAPSKPDNVALPLSEISALKEGDVVFVTRRDGSVAQGEYAGADTLSSAEYTDCYKRQMVSLSSAMVAPIIGDSVTVVTRERTEMKTRTGTEVWKRAELHARLIGFNPGAIRVQLYGVRTWTQLPLDALDTMYYRQGWSVTGETLRQHMDSGNIPFLSCDAVILRERDALRIPLGQISQIEQERSKNAKWNYLIIGVAVDAILAFATHESLRHTPF